MRVRSSCCEASLALSLTDLAGNTALCTAGPLLSRAGDTHNTLGVIMIVVLVTIILNMREPVGNIYFIL